MLNDPFFILIVIAVLAVLVILILGLGNFAAGGGKNQAERSNKLMRYRVGAQFVAVILIAIYVYAKMGGQ